MGPRDDNIELNFYFELMLFFIFLGSIAKSSQFLMHAWLPDAMEGPTPVSALIHAATMVTAGLSDNMKGVPKAVEAYVKLIKENKKKKNENKK